MFFSSTESKSFIYFVQFFGQFLIIGNYSQQLFPLRNFLLIFSHFFLQLRLTFSKFPLWTKLTTCHVFWFILMWKHIPLFLFILFCLFWDRIISFRLLTSPGWYLLVNSGKSFIVKMIDLEIACGLYSYPTDTIDIDFVSSVFKKKKDETVVMRLSSSVLSI